MTLHRSFRSRGESFALVAAHAVGAGAPRIAVRGPRAAALLAPLFADAIDARALRLIAAELTSVASPLQDREVLARLVAAIDSGRLVPVRVEPLRKWGVYQSGQRADRSETADDRPLEPRVDATHWIEIRLVDDDDAGISGQRYLIIDPDGRPHRGYTDSLGSARITRLSPGTCRVSFPDLDGSVCELATTPG
ncbi:hypothetical protein [Nannocystis pusilla]|uniref:Uncharacterized protein n=1 Tax=Nannocystis pusilla TaxID=889268 RepID=A0ABS7TR59_9BACT|nr:hypothetical protein [Nannocystis pusilla]MBZ5710705.1 hypothetical protein [Nannocystis pusilla]